MLVIFVFCFYLWWSFCPVKPTICAVCVEDIMGNICVKYFKFRLVVQEMQLKDFFSILKLDQRSRRRCWL